jgi:ubiquitin-conjugating enzyme E2 O
LVGAEETIIPSRIYSEKALCLSKGFVSHALRMDIGCMKDVVKWLYHDKDGPELLKKIVNDSKELLLRKPISEGTIVNGPRPLSAGAKILLEQHIPSLEEFLNHKTD